MLTILWNQYNFRRSQHGPAGLTGRDLEAEFIESQRLEILQEDDEIMDILQAIITQDILWQN